MVEDRKSSAHGQNDAIDPGCVKTCTSQGCPELFSQLPSSDRSCQCNWFLHRRNRDGNSTRKLGVGVFTQPGPRSDVSQPLRSQGVPLTTAWCWFESCRAHHGSFLNLISLGYLPDLTTDPD